MTPSPNGGHQTDETLLTTRRRLGDELRHLRSAQRLSLRRVAETLGLAPSTLSAYERGRRPLPPVALRQLCVLYRVPVRRLVAVLGNREMNAEERADDCLKIRFDFDGLEAARSPEARIVADFVATIRRQRGTVRPSDGAIAIRGRDLQAMGELLEIPTDDLVRRLRDEGLLRRPVGRPRRGGLY